MFIDAGGKRVPSPVGSGMLAVNQRTTSRVSIWAGAWSSVTQLRRPLRSGRRTLSPLQVRRPFEVPSQLSQQ